MAHEEKREKEREEQQETQREQQRDTPNGKRRKKPRKLPHSIPHLFSRFSYRHGYGFGHLFLVMQDDDTYVPYTKFTRLHFIQNYLYEPSNVEIPTHMWAFRDKDKEGHRTVRLYFAMITRGQRAKVKDFCHDLGPVEALTRTLELDAPLKQIVVVVFKRSTILTRKFDEAKYPDPLTGKTLEHATVWTLGRIIQYCLLTARSRFRHREKGAISDTIAQLTHSFGDTTRSG